VAHHRVDCHDVNVKTSAELVGWANGLADELEMDMAWNDGVSGGWWSAEPADKEWEIEARAVSALDFLERFAGHESQLFVRAQRLLDSDGNRKSRVTGARAIAAVLRVWCRQVEGGILVPRHAEALEARSLVSTDLMVQVQTLVEDREVHVAAPIVLAGAALEMGLRSAVEELGLDYGNKGSISAYAQALRRAQILTVQDVKDVEQMGGIRNSAAHGQFEDLSRERAGLLQQQINMFLRRLADLMSDQK
jgi:hypothetical protein